jgi:type I restriction enzyme, R subunit
MPHFTEATVEAAAVEWFGQLGYAVAHAPHLAPGEATTERSSFGDVVLVARLRDAIVRLNPAIPDDAREEALRKVLRLERPPSSAITDAFIRCCAMASKWNIAARTAASPVIAELSIILSEA